MAQFLHGWGAELTADDYAKAIAAVGVMEAFGISVAGGSLTSPAQYLAPWFHVRRRGNLFDLGFEMDCLVHQESRKVRTRA